MGKLKICIYCCLTADILTKLFFKIVSRVVFYQPDEIYSSCTIWQVVLDDKEVEVEVFVRNFLYAYFLKTFKVPASYLPSLEYWHLLYPFMPLSQVPGLARGQDLR